MGVAGDPRHHPTFGDRKLSLIRPISEDALAEAAAILSSGGLVGLPTETVYGLAADATNPIAVARVFAAKGRPAFNPLIAHVPDLASAQVHGDFSPLAERLAEAFWPGPLTLVVRRKTGSAVALLACAGLDTVALRVPAHPAARALLTRVKTPLAAPSANRSGRVSPTAAAHVAQELGDAVGLILDGGPCLVGLESTVVSVEGDRATLLRPGGITRAAIEAISGPLAAPDADDAPASPGMLASHYAPNAQIRLNAPQPNPGEAYLAFGPAASPEIALTDGLNLSPTADLVEAAANLFGYLRRLDASGARVIAVAPIPMEGLGEAINDRLARAAIR